MSDEEVELAKFGSLTNMEGKERNESRGDSRFENLDD